MTTLDEARPGQSPVPARVAAVAGGICAAFGAVFLIGWLLGDGGAAFVSSRMKANTALGYALVGAAIVAQALRARERDRAPHPRSARTDAAGLASPILAAVAAAVAIATAIEYAVDVDLGLDELIARDPDVVRETDGRPGRLAPNTALAIGGLALAVLTAQVRRLGAVSQLFSCVVLAVGTLPVTAAKAEYGEMRMNDVGR